MRSSDTLLREIKIPDVLPTDLPKGPTFSLVAGEPMQLKPRRYTELVTLSPLCYSYIGDFEEIYGKLAEDDEREPQQGKWDAVLTCFFIDTVRELSQILLPS
jgi:carnosine N-methyltransferase